ncbi:50S ribosomal protein L23 [Candidatus Babeliales bacterium]|nr:50S ribosomal protein L23 [Candidatus Babeliales bacterium]
MDLKIYDVIKNVFSTTKSNELFRKLGKITFEIAKDANKIMVKKAVEGIWSVKVKNVRVLSIKGKSKTFARKSFKTPNRKKAIVTLKEGYKIDLPGQFESMGVPAAVEAKAEMAKGK